MKRKLICLTMTLCLVVTSAFGSVGSLAYGASDDSQGTETENFEVPETGDVVRDFVRDSETGAISPKEPLEVPESEEAAANPEGRTTAVLPRLYPPGDAGEVIAAYPATRNQNPYGTCWAHGALACAEFDLIKNHGHMKTVDLSELQLAYYTYHTANDRLGNLDGDQNYIPYDATKNYLDVGGNALYAMQNLSQWKGLATENELSYSWAPNSLIYGVDNAYAYANGGAKLENSYYIDIKSNPSAVKEAIRTYGAVHASYYHNSQFYSLNGYALYYCPYAYGVNHSIAIVGWNDDLPASSFPSGNRPSRNGGWLVRNSWSTVNNGSESCYFWMSYEDKSLENVAYVFDFVPGSKWSNIYQHDGTSGYGTIAVEKAANVFTAQNPDGAGSEALQAVMLSFMHTSDVKYQIDIYTGLSSGTTKNPESGRHHKYATTTGTTTHAGVHTVYLKKPVYLAPGEKYAIVVTAKEGRQYFTSENTWNYSYYENGKEVGWFTSVASADQGESLYKTSASQSGWADVATDGLYDYGNLRIKGLTTNVSGKRYNITYKLNGGSTVSNPGQYLSTDESIKLKSPTKSGYHFLGWYTDSDYTNKVTAIKGSMGKNLTLYAKWGAHKYQEKVIRRATAKEKGLLRKSCTGCSVSTDYYILVPDASLAYTKTSYNGEKKCPDVTVSNKNGTISSKHYTVSYSNNREIGKGKVTIKMNDYYYDCTFTKYFTIRLGAPSNVKVTTVSSSGKPKVTWNKVKAASKYEVYRKVGSNGTWKKQYTTNSTSYINTSATAGKVYYYKVKAIYSKNSNGNSAFSKYDYVTCDLARPEIKVSGLKKRGKIVISWKKVSGADRYYIYRATSKNGTYKKYDSATGTTYTNSSVTKGKTYYYKVKAVYDGKSKANSAYSNVDYARVR